MFKKSFVFSAVLMSFCLALGAQTRVVRSINDGWLFTKEGVSEIVNIPHCWNAQDTWDETAGYYRGECTYRRSVRICDDLGGKKVYVRFEGAGQVCELTVNDKVAGKHIGGYTAFIFDVTNLVREGDNDFLIKVDNAHNPDIPPLSADFTFYGGIYRDVELVITPADHICNTHYASNGVYITTPVVSKSASKVRTRTLLDVKEGKYSVIQRVYDPDGKLVATSTKKVGKKDTECIQEFAVKDCRLWDVDSPDVYRVITSLCDSKGNEIDKVENPLGFRTFSFDAENGFTLNGRHLKLMGTNRHQDFKEMGNALSDGMHMRDIKLLRDMGGNFLRIAHYPQDPIVTQLCDRFGIVCSVEIPIVDYVTESQAFKDNCTEMAKEMVCQDFNSPSVIIWAYMNEVLLKPIYKKKDPRLTNYYATVCDQARAINSAIKELDNGRYTMIPCNGDPKKYVKAGLDRVPDIIGWNYYCGWYSRKVEDFEKEIAKAHSLVPDKPVILTEYGAGIDPRLHSRAPERFDFSMEYGLIFHKHYLDIIRSTPYIAGSNVWNLNDFYCERRVDAVPHVNNKGLVGLDRVPKDTYLLYQASLLGRPFLAIGGREWKKRSGVEGEKQTIEVYTNQGSVKLFLNGEQVGESKVVNGWASFAVCLSAGENVIAAQTPDGLRDAIRVDYAAVPKDMNKFTSMNVMLGSNRYFDDQIQGMAWMPEQEYTPGSWGYVGGNEFRRKSTSANGSYLGTNADILGTINDPIFQTQRVGIQSFKADVPAGKYYVWLYFAELAVQTTGEPLPYNLGNDTTAIEETERIFNVSINGNPVLRNYNPRIEDGPCRAAIRKFTIDVQDGQGISIDFDKVSGQPVLNAVSIYRCF